MAATSTVAIIGAIVAAAGTTAAVENASQQKRLGSQALNRTKGDQASNRKRAEDDSERAGVQASQDAARIRQKGVKSDRAGTILSGPAGDTGYGGAPTLGAGQGKTLLGQ